MITVDGDKFVIARWIPDMYLKNFDQWVKEFDDESIVKCSEIAVLRNQADFNKLGDKIQRELQERYEELAGNEPESDVLVWSWHIPDPLEPGKQPDKMVLFRGEEEICTVWFEQVDPL